MQIYILGTTNAFEKFFQCFQGLQKIGMEQTAEVRKIRTTKPLFFDSYKKNRITGSLVLIDEGTNETVGAGMIL